MVKPAPSPASAPSHALPVAASPPEDGQTVPGVTAMSTVAAVLSQGRLPGGGSFRLRPWLAIDDVWLGRQARVKGVTIRDIVRARLGWGLEELNGAAMEREEQERSREAHRPACRAMREAAVSALGFGDWLTLIVLQEADDSESVRWSGGCSGCQTEFPVEFRLADLPVRVVVTEDRAALEFVAGERRFGPVGNTAMSALRAGSNAEIEMEMARAAFIDGPPLDQIRRRDLRAVTEEIDRRIPAPVWSVSTKCPKCGEPWEGSVPVAQFLSGR